MLRRTGRSVDAVEKRFHFTGDIKKLETGLGIMAKRLAFAEEPSGLPVHVEKAGRDTVYAAFDGTRGVIKYHTASQFFRALGLFAGSVPGGVPFKMEETPYFATNGVMLDSSRNAVPTVDSVKRLLEHMALMGLSLLMLYTEDTYEIKELPYFGYMRGRYTFEELKQCDDYADLLGIEMVPCIQTLAHLAQALKWNGFKEVRDTGDILLAGSEKTYELVERMIRAASAPFRSRRIHVGMDEAHNLGLGKYLEQNGFCRRFDIMNGHLQRVVGIAEGLGLEPMIWSDMFFTLGSASGTYFDLDSVVPEDAVQAMSRSVKQVYWDYYHNDEEYYRKFIKKHREIGIEPLFAGGIWSFAGIAVNYVKTFAAAGAALSACRKEGVREVIATVWNDDGAETNLFASLLGMQFFAENGYGEPPSADRLKERFELCTGGCFEGFLAFSGFDTLPGAEQESLLEKPANPSKYLLWQDILAGLFDRHVEGFDVEGHYLALGERMRRYAAENGSYTFLFDMLHRLCDVLAAKGSIGLRLRELYLKKDGPALRHMADETLPQLREKAERLRKAHRALWFATCKPFGWEVLDIRYGGLLARVETAASRIGDYLDGRIERIEELEEERLYFDGPVRPDGAVLGRCNQYNRIVSASML